MIWAAGWSALCLQSCCITGTMNVRYEPQGMPRGTVSDAPLPVLYLAPVQGDESRLWYRSGNAVWTLGEPPTLIVHKALAQELGRMGVMLTDRPGHGRGRLETDIRWFGPFGNSCSTAAVILSLALYPKDAAEPIWRGRMEGGARFQASAGIMARLGAPAEKAASDALGKAIRQLEWNVDFRRALTSLSRE
jgi:hypothetical protein